MGGFCHPKPSYLALLLAGLGIYGVYGALLEHDWKPATAQLLLLTMAGCANREGNKEELRTFHIQGDWGQPMGVFKVDLPLY